MTGPPSAEQGLLTAALIRTLFDDLSSNLRQAGSSNHHMMIAGGAALALRWGDRLTRDVDVLDHRLRWQGRSHGERHTATVDFISMRFPAELLSAADLVAAARGLRSNWLNNAVGLYTPACDLQAEVLYRSDQMTIEAPGPRVLLAMKLHARRDRDLEDAARLIRETNIADPERLAGLVAAAYGPAAVTTATERFASRAIDFPLPHTEPTPRTPGPDPATEGDRGLDV